MISSKNKYENFLLVFKCKIVKNKVLNKRQKGREVFFTVIPYRGSKEQEPD